MLHDENVAFVQKARQDNTSYSLARLQRGQTRGRGSVLYTRENIQSAAAITVLRYNKGCCYHPSGVKSVGLWNTARSNKHFFFNLHFMQLWPPWHSRLDMCCSTNTTLSYPNRHVRHMHRRLHWLSLQSQSGEGSEVEARAASILQAIHSQQYESLQPWPAVIINSIVYKHSIRCKQLS